MENEYFRSERLLYRPYQMRDVEALVAFRNEDSRRKWFYFQEPDILTEECAIKHINENITLWSNDMTLLDEEKGLAVVLKDSNKLIGFVGLGKSRCDDVEIGYEIGEQYQNQGYATEAINAAVEWGFSRLRELGAELKIVGKPEPANIPSCRVLEKAGFTFSHAEEYLSVYKILG